MGGGMTSEYHEAVRRMKAQKRFRIHLIVFLSIQTMVVILNALFWQGYAWAVWPILGWGVGLLFHAASAYAPRGNRLDEKHVLEIMKTLKK